MSVVIAEFHNNLTGLVFLQTSNVPSHIKSQLHQTWYHYIMLGMVSCVCYSNFVPMTHRFWDIRLVTIQWPWNRG